MKQESKQDIILRLREGLNAQQRSVPQLPAQAQARKIKVLGAKTDPKHPFAGYMVGADESAEPGKKNIGPDKNDPYEKGWRAGFRHNESNPYPAGSKQAAQWDRGYAEAEAQPNHYDESLAEVDFNPGRRGFLKKAGAVAATAAMPAGLAGAAAKAMAPAASWASTLSAPLAGLTAIDLDDIINLLMSSKPESMISGKDPYDLDIMKSIAQDAARESWGNAWMKGNAAQAFLDAVELGKKKGMDGEDIIQDLFIVAKKQYMQELKKLSPEEVAKVKSQSLNPDNKSEPAASPTTGMSGLARAAGAQIGRTMKNVGKATANTVLNQPAKSAALPAPSVSPSMQIPKQKSRVSAEQDKELGEAGKSLRKNYNPDGKTFKGDKNKMPTYDPDDAMMQGDYDQLDTVSAAVADDEIAKAEHRMDLPHLKQLIKSQLKILDKTEREILNYLYWHDQPLVQIAKTLGMEPILVHRIKDKALKKLLHSPDLYNIAKNRFAYPYARINDMDESLSPFNDDHSELDQFVKEEFNRHPDDINEESGAVVAHGYAYNRQDQRVAWTREFASEAEAKEWARRRNATVLSIVPKDSIEEGWKSKLAGAALAGAAAFGGGGAQAQTTAPTGVNATGNNAAIVQSLVNPVAQQRFAKMHADTTAKLTDPRYNHNPNALGQHQAAPKQQHAEMLQNIKNIEQWDNPYRIIQMAMNMAGVTPQEVLQNLPQGYKLPTTEPKTAPVRLPGDPGYVREGAGTVSGNNPAAAWPDFGTAKTYESQLAEAKQRLAEAESRFVLYFNGKPASHYATEAEAKRIADSIKAKHPDVKIEIKNEMHEGDLNEVTGDLPFDTMLSKIVAGGNLQTLAAKIVAKIKKFPQYRMPGDDERDEFDWPNGYPDGHFFGDDLWIDDSFNSIMGKWKSLGPDKFADENEELSFKPSMESSNDYTSYWNGVLEVLRRLESIPGATEQLAKMVWHGLFSGNVEQGITDIGKPGVSEGKSGIDKYVKLLKNHDWTYDYGDDQEAQRGYDERQVLLRLAKNLDPKFKIWNEYAPADIYKKNLSKPKDNYDRNDPDNWYDESVAEGKPQKRADRYHINKDGKPASLASYADKSSAIKDRDAKYPDAKVHQVGPRGKVKGEFEEGMAEGKWNYPPEYTKKANADDEAELGVSLINKDARKAWRKKQKAKAHTDLMTGKKKEPGVSEGAKVDRMVKHIASSEKATGKSNKDAENIAWATVNKRGYLDNKNKKKHVAEAGTPADIRAKNRAVVKKIQGKEADIDEGWKSKLAGAALAGAAALGGGAAAAHDHGDYGHYDQRVDDRSWDISGYDDHIKSDTKLTKTTTPDGKVSRDSQRRISSVQGPNAQGEYRVLVGQNGKIVSSYITKTPPQDWMVKEDITQEDIITKLKAKLGDYLSDLGQQIKKDPALQDKLSAKPPGDQVGPPVKTLTTDDGHEISIHGNEDDGFRISIKNKQTPSKFDSLDEAVMACEMYRAHRRRQALTADYVEEA